MREDEITGFRSLIERINIIIYALLLRRRHEHCSNGVGVCVCACVRADLVLFTETRFGGILKIGISMFV